MKKFIDWFKSIQWKKWFTWNYICLLIYLASIIVSLIREEYNVAGVYCITVILCVIIHLKDRSLEQAKELIKSQGKLIDNMLSLLNEIDNHKAKKN